jgi:hypothetical protein
MPLVMAREENMGVFCVISSMGYPAAVQSSASSSSVKIFPTRIPTLTMATQWRG